MANAVNQKDRSRFACKICARLVADPVMIADGPRLAEQLGRLRSELWWRFHEAHKVCSDASSWGRHSVPAGMHRPHCAPLWRFR